MFLRHPSILPLPLRRHTALLPHVRRTLNSTSSPSASTTARYASTSTHDDPAQASDHHNSHDHGHGSHYDPPTGWLWGLRPGEKYEKEGWEDLFYYGFFGSLLLTAVAYAFKPDTSIQTWALEEARRRLEREGILEDPDVKK
ncbi:MAG: hypothetical protein Q9160_003985 [Pyrenula sp. 1 TL-2023]